MEIREGDVILSKVVFTDLSEIKKTCIGYK